MRFNAISTHMRNPLCIVLCFVVLGLEWRFRQRGFFLLLVSTTTWAERCGTVRSYEANASESVHTIAILITREREETIGKGNRDDGEEGKSVGRAAAYPVLSRPKAFSVRPRSGFSGGFFVYIRGEQVSGEKSNDVGAGERVGWDTGIVDRPMAVGWVGWGEMDFKNVIYIHPIHPFLFSLPPRGRREG